MDPVVDARIRLPAGIIISGPPQSGKTVFTLDLLDNLDRIADKPVQRIFWFYGAHTPTISLLDSKYQGRIQTVHGLPDDFSNLVADDGSHTLAIFDDLLREASESKALVDLTSRQSSHGNISWVLILQDLFYKGKERVTLLRNAHYIVQFKNPLNHTIPYLLAQRVLPQDRKAFMEIFQKATSRPHGHLLIDGTQQASELLRFRTDIFGEFQIAYVPKTVLKSVGLKLSA